MILQGLIFRATEGGGDSYGAILFQPVKPAITAPADITVPANNTGCTASNIALGNPVISPVCGTITNNAPAVFPVGTTTVTWIITDGNGNTALATQHVTVTGLARPAQPGLITGRKNYLCGGGTFTYSISPVPDATGYIWQAPAGFVVANHGTSADITVPSNFGETAVISVAATNACSTSRFRNAKLYAIALPLHSIISGPAAVSVNARGVIYSVAKHTGITYTWSVPAGAVIKAGQGTNRIRANFGNASGYITVNASNACDPGKEIAQLYVTVGNAAIATTLPSGGNGLTVYPNPAQTIAKLVFDEEDEGMAYTITVTDMAGKVLQTKTGITTEGSNMVNIDLSKYAGGVYIISLIDGEESKSISVVKER